MVPVNEETAFLMDDPMSALKGEGTLGSGSKVVVEPLSSFATLRGESTNYLQLTHNLVKKVGDANFGKVFLWSHKETGKPCVVKRMANDQRNWDGHMAMVQGVVGRMMLNDMSKICRAAEDPIVEIGACKYFAPVDGRERCPTLLNGLDAWIDTDYVYSLMEFADGGELFDAVVSRKFLAEYEARQYFTDLCMAVQYLHRRGVAHRDISLENILLASDESNPSGRKIAKLMDYGQAVPIYCTAEDDVALHIFRPEPDDATKGMERRDLVQRDVNGAQYCYYVDYCGKAYYRPPEVIRKRVTLANPIHQLRASRLAARAAMDPQTGSQWSGGSSNSVQSNSSQPRSDNSMLKHKDDPDKKVTQASSVLSGEETLKLPYYRPSPVDVFMCGVCLYHLLVGKALWQNCCAPDVRYLYVKKYGLMQYLKERGFLAREEGIPEDPSQPVPSVPKAVSADGQPFPSIRYNCAEMLERMLFFDPEKRATIEDICQSPWMVMVLKNSGDDEDWPMQ